MWHLHAYHLFRGRLCFPLHLPLHWQNLFRFHPRDFQRIHWVEVEHHHLLDPEFNNSVYPKNFSRNFHIQNKNKIVQLREQNFRTNTIFISQKKENVRTQKTLSCASVLFSFDLKVISKFTALKTETNFPMYWPKNCPLFAWNNKFLRIKIFSNGK